ncbi:MAG: hypothetical protein ISR80_05335 [Nitrosopumilus sp.]|nr:hypothetical protein [Nitrosopumilus sp.]
MKMSVDVVQDRLSKILDSKSQNEKRIKELSEQAEILRKRLQIDNQK